MAYTTIPTLADGNILTAAHHNLLGDNANYLNVKYHTTSVYANGDPSGTPTIKCDLNSLGLTVGNWYTVQVDCAFGGGSSMDLQLIYEYPT